MRVSGETLTAQPRAQVLVALRVFGLLWPKLEVGESAEGSLYRFMVRVELPWGAPLGHYEGWLRLVEWTRFEKIVVSDWRPPYRAEWARHVP